MNERRKLGLIQVRCIRIGKFGASELLPFLLQWGTGPGGPSDFDGNGSVGVSDLLALLANWGPCP